MTDTMDTITCPACGKVMQKYFIETGCAIDICTDGCGGMFFNNQEIQELNDSHSDIEEIKKLLKSKKFISVDENLTRVCPVCGTKMAKTRALGIQIDTCYKCNSIFLDNGEFELVRSSFKKRKKVKQLDMNNNDINIRDFYKDAQDELFMNDEGYNNIKKIAFGHKRKLSLLDIISNIIFY